MNICKYRSLYTNEILSIIESKKICNFITTNLDDITITPMWYAFDYNNENFIFYFINMSDEKNLNELKSNDKVCISLENYVLGFYIDAYQSVSAHGRIDFVNDSNEQKDILLKFEKRYSHNLQSKNHSTFKYVKVTITNIIGRQY